MMQGVEPGPQMLRETPDLLFAAVLGLIGATILLVFIGWKTAMVMVRVISIDRQIVNIVALFLVCIGVYAIRGRVFDVFVCLTAGVIGYFMLRYGYSTAALALAVIVAPRLESSLRTGLRLEDYDLTRFFGRPITLTLVIISALMLSYGIWSEISTRRKLRANALEKATV